MSKSAFYVNLETVYKDYNRKRKCVTYIKLYYISKLECNYDIPPICDR